MTRFGTIGLQKKDYGGTTTKGFNSTIVRFIRNHQKDTWIISDNPLLGGAEFEAYEGWVGKTNFNTYRQKLLPLMSQLSSYSITKLQTGKLQQQQMVKSMVRLN